MNLTKKAIFFIFLLITACQSQNTQNIECIIEGEFINASERVLYLYELKVKEMMLIDSTVCSNAGAFDFIINPKQKGFYFVKGKKEGHIAFIAGAGDRISIKGDYNDMLGHYSAEGSAETEFLHKYFRDTEEHNKIMDSLTEEFFKAREEKNPQPKVEKLTEAYYKLEARQKELATDYLKANPDYLASLFIINQKFEKNRLFNIDKDSALFLMLDSALLNKYPDNTHSIEHHERIQAYKRMKIQEGIIEQSLLPGKEAPGFTLKSSSGIAYNTDAFKGREYCLYFWAAWSAESRKMNRSLIEALPVFNAKDVKLIGISLDENRTQWESAIKIDKLEWLQLSDLMGFKSPLARQYNIKDIPSFCLISKEGLIIKRSKDLGDIINSLSDRH